MEIHPIEQAVNYQPLVGDGQAFRGGWKRSLHKPLSWVLLLALIPAAFYLIKYGTPMPIFFVAALYAAYLGHVINQYKTEAWKTFAAANNWPIDTATNPQLILAPSLQYGRSPKFSPIIQARLFNTSCDLYMHTCVVGSGKSQRTDYHTVARITLPATLPHILLRSRGALGLMNEARDIPNGESLKLEGNFNKYFSLQMERDKQIDVLTVLTPDVMQTLIARNHKQDIEIASNNLYFIVNGDQREPRDVQQLIESMQVLHKDILENINFPTTASSAA